MIVCMIMCKKKPHRSSWIRTGNLSWQPRRGRGRRRPAKALSSPDHAPSPATTKIDEDSPVAVDKEETPWADHFVSECKAAGYLTITNQRGNKS